MLNAASEFLRQLQARGARIKALGDILRIEAPEGVLTDEIKHQIVELKPYLLKLFHDAISVLNRRGARQIRGGDKIIIGLRKDADDHELREALHVVGLGTAEVMYVEHLGSGAGRYDQFVAHAAQRRASGGPSAVTPVERLEAEVKARRLNRLFDLHGTAPRPSRITTATVLHGMARKNGPRTK